MAPELAPDADTASEGGDVDEAGAAGAGASVADGGVGAEADGSMGAAVSRAKQATAADAIEVRKIQQRLYKREFAHFVTASDMVASMDQLQI